MIIKEQRSGGVKLPTPKRCAPVGDRTMKSKNGCIAPAFTINNIEYKGNAVLRANS